MGTSVVKHFHCHSLHLRNKSVQEILFLQYKLNICYLCNCILQEVKLQCILTWQKQATQLHHIGKCIYFLLIILIKMVFKAFLNILWISWPLNSQLSPRFLMFIWLIMIQNQLVIYLNESSIFKYWYDNVKI